MKYILLLIVSIAFGIFFGVLLNLFGWTVRGYLDEDFAFFSIRFSIFTSVIVFIGLFLKEWSE